VDDHGVAAIMASIIRRALTPTMSLMIESSLMSASPRVSRIATQP
jgi:hypothetical protein